MSTKQEPRGVRINTPGNIDRTKTVWQGEDRSAAALRREPRFCVFKTPQAGFRALAKRLLTYQSKHGLRTVREMISRWANISNEQIRPSPPMPMGIRTYSACGRPMTC